MHPRAGDDQARGKRGSTPQRPAGEAALPWPAGRSGRDHSRWRRQRCDEVSRASEWDVVVAGAGHNSLLTAAYAARAGLKVLVLEGAARIGGDTTSEGLTLPGVTHDPCSTAHNLIQSNPLMRNDALQLDRYGLRYLYPDPGFTLPFRDGRSVTMWRDLERTCAELARFSSSDANAYRELLNDWQAMSPIVNEERENPPKAPQEVAARIAGGKHGQRMLDIRRST